MIDTAALVAKLIGQIRMPRIEGRASFVAWLKLCHGVMRSSGPLLELAASKADGELRDYYRAHLVEERDHADWLAADLATMGEEPPRIDHVPAAIAGAQYYYLQHIGPHALLGYMAALEFRPMPMAEVDQLAKTYGEAALRTVRFHAQHDPDHREALARMINRCEEFADLIVYNAMLTATMCAFYLTERMKEVRHA